MGKSGVVAWLGARSLMDWGLVPLVVFVDLV